MNGKEFIRKARKWAKANDREFAVNASRGKGGHKMVQVGDRRTTVKTGEIGTGLLAAMLEQLNIPKGEF
ncbi:MAG TPA: hypothetical protein VFB02_14020 [Bradyrhizobium sp.]|nr:hypothetical protein [Bradyrhizobium sp.]